MTSTTLPPEAPTNVDFIVVGGGQSGLVVASRLSEDPAKTVLVIEAGSNRLGDPRIDTPGLMTTLYDDPEYDWKHLTAPQPNVNNRQIGWPRGKVLGGTSAMNFSALVYPAKSDFDNWAALVGDQIWNSSNMMPYLKKYHKFESCNAELSKRMMMDWVDEDAQGYDGPLTTCFTDELGPFNEAWMKTFEHLGHRFPGDPIAGEKRGVFQNPLSVESGRRAYSASAYYAGAAERSNLHIITDALVEKICLERNGLESELLSAARVQYVDASGAHTVKAKKEVIVACGAIKSPQLLELSGIGDKHLLSRLGIETIIENGQVGENLQDHVLASISFEIADDQVSGDVMRDPKIVEAVLKQYQGSLKGPLSGTPLSFAYTPLVDKAGTIPSHSVEGLLRDHVDKTSAQKTVPSQAKQYKILREQLLNPQESTIEFMYIPLQLNGNLEGQPTDMTTLFSKSFDGNYITLVTMLMHPFSRGSIHVTSANAADQPSIDPEYLQHPLDIEMLARALSFTTTIAETEPLASLLKPGGRTIPPAARDLVSDDSLPDANRLEAFKELVRERLFTAFHPSGTCAMLPREQGGVVDGRLRVYGTTNLRIVDASVFPVEPLGHLQSTVYAVAEKAADMIKADWS